MGPNAARLSSTAISRLKAAWWEEHERWQHRDLGARRIVYVWADGVYFQPRMAEERQCVLVLIGAEAEAALDFFVDTDGVKYDKAVTKLVTDREVLLAFHNVPAEHWKHIRTSNPIESTFATVRHRTGKTRGCISPKTGLAIAFTLMMSAQVKWRKLDGANRLPEIAQAIAFEDGIKELPTAA